MSCGSISYPPSAFDGPTGAELGEDDAAKALRDLIENPDGIEGIPQSGWRRLFDSDDAVVYGSGEPVNDGGEQGLVTEMQCTGGAPVDDRLNEPLVRYGPTTIEVLFTARPLEGEAFPCIGNQPSPTTLHLDEPVGKRRILDLSGYPPRDATARGQVGSAG